MKLSRLWILAVPLLLVLFVIAPVGGDLFLTLTFPFTMMGDLLRSMSLSGAVGNAVAIVLYVLFCLSPLLLIRRRDSVVENALLVLASAVMFRVMWQMINPSHGPVILQNEVGRAINCGTVYSVFITWGVIRLLNASDLVRQENIYKTLRIFLMICAVELILEGIGMGFAALRTQLELLAEGNTMPGQDLMPTVVFLVLDYVVGAVENGMVAWLMVLGIRLLRALENDPYSTQCHRVSETICLWCRRTIRVVVIASLALNLGQMLFANVLLNIGFTIRIPAVSLGIAFCMMALSRLLAQGRELKEDNDLFI